MAELKGLAQLPAAEPISREWTEAKSRAQLGAIAWMRWRIFVNSFRRTNKKRSTAGMVLILLLRVVAWGIFGAFLVGPIAGSGFAAYYAPSRLGMILWAISSVQFFISINAMPGTVGFDLTPLMRFPIGFREYLLVRLFFGLVSIPTVVANFCFLAVAVGIGVARHSLFPWAAMVVGLLALNNVFFLRMVLAWVDRWMATRRAREMLGGLVLLLSLGFQFFAMEGRLGRHGHMPTMVHRLGFLHPLAQYLPPGLAADAILHRGGLAAGPAYAGVLGVAGFALVFLAIFAMRLKREFRGENLSEAGRRPVRTEPKQQRVRAAGMSAAGTGDAAGAGTPSAIAACLQKEVIYLRRSGAQLYGLITPIFFVFVLSHTNRILGASNMLLPYAVSYVMFGLLAGLYNVLGADGAGFSLYLLAPVRLRDVLIAKNLVNGGVIATEILLAVVAVWVVKGVPPSAAMLTATLLWAGFALLVNLTVGNLRSLLAPMRFELGKMRRAPMAKGGALISMGVLLGTLGTGIPVIFACRHFGHIWLAAPIFLALDAAALLAYLLVMGRVDRIGASHRDGLIEALCKT